MHKLKTMTKIAFFDAHSYDRDSFNTWNKDFNYEIHYYTERLTMNTVELANGKDVVCVFVNDALTAPVIEKLVAYGTCRCRVCRDTDALSQPQGLPLCTAHP